MADDEKPKQNKSVSEHLKALYEDRWSLEMQNVSDRIASELVDTMWRQREAELAADRARHEGGNLVAPTEGTGVIPPAVWGRLAKKDKSDGK